MMEDQPKSKEIEASMIINHNLGDCRTLKQIVGTGDRYSCSTRECRIQVKASPVGVIQIQQELEKIGIIIADYPSVTKVAKKFSKELTSIKGGLLVSVDERGHSGLYIVTEFLEDEETLNQHGFTKI